MTRLSSYLSNPEEPDVLTRGGTVVDEFIVEPLRNLWVAFVQHLPAVLTSLVVLVVLLIVARLVRAAVRRLLGLSRLDSALADTRIATILNAFKKDLAPSGAIAYLAYFGVVLLAWMTAADIVGLRAVRSTLEAILGYLPNLVSALLVLTLGGWIAGLARRAVSAMMAEIRSPYARLLEGLTEFLLLVVVVTVAINVLGVDVSLITSNLTILIGCFALTIAFLFAWSMRRPAEHIIANYYLRRMLRVGDRVSVSRHVGVLSAFSPLGIVVQDDAGIEHFVPARVVFDGLDRTERMKKR